MLVHWFWCYKMMQKLWKTVLQFLKKIYTVIINSTPRYIFNINENVCPHQNFYTNVYSSMITIAKN